MWSNICLLSTHNRACAKLLAQLIKLRTHFPYYLIKKIHLDNAGKFTSHDFNECCMLIGIEVEHPITHVHTKNGLAKTLIKCLKLIARSLLMKANLSMAT